MVDLENTSKIEILKGLETAFVDKHVDSKNIYQPKLISNDYKKGIKVLPYIEKELSTCEEFFISVAFITNSGIEPLMQVLKELNTRGVEK
jgi:HKD family nuclease